MEIKTITWDEFEKTYKPNKNSEGEYIRYWNEDELLQARKENRVWTQLDVDSDTKFVIANGMHFVNRMDYFICEVPYNKGEEIEAVDIEEMNIYLNLDECYSWYKLPKIEQIKSLYEDLLKSQHPITYEMNIRDWKLLTESVEILTLDEALKKFEPPIKNKKSWLQRVVYNLKKYILK